MASLKKALLEKSGARLKEIEGVLTRLEKEIHDLNEERDALNVLRRRYGAAPRNGAAPRDVTRSVEGAKKPTPTKAVLDLIRKEPGLKVPEIMDRLQGRIATSSANERRLIASVVDVLMRRRKILEKDAEGRVSLKPE